MLFCWNLLANLPCSPLAPDCWLLQASAPAPLQVYVTQSVVSSISGGSRTPAIIPIAISLGEGMMPSGNQITVTATYLKDGTNPRVAVCKFEVPMVLLCTAVPPVKNAEFKVRTGILHIVIVFAPRLLLLLLLHPLGRRCCNAMECGAALTALLPYLQTQPP